MQIRSELTENHVLKIYEDPADNQYRRQVQACPRRGGLICGMKYEGQDIIVPVPPEVLSHRSRKVRGGIPIMFPQAGPGPGTQSRFPKLPQHGNARDSAWWAPLWL